MLTFENIANAGFALVKGCLYKERGNANACLKKFFHDTGQRIPPVLEHLLNVEQKDNPAKQKRDQENDKGYKTPTFEQSWCE